MANKVKIWACLFCARSFENKKDALAHLFTHHWRVLLKRIAARK